MTQNVYVTVSGKQYIDKESTEEIVNKAQGQYTKRDGMQFVTFEIEVDEEGTKQKCLLKFNNENLELTQKGALNTKFLYIKGTKTLSDYNTPYGIFKMGIFTKEYTFQEKEGKIKLHVLYDMEFSGEYTAENETNIEIEFT